MSYQITKLLMVRSVPFKYRVTSFSCCSSFYLPLSSKLHQDQHHRFFLQTPRRSVSTTSPSWKAMKKTYPSLKEKFMKGQSKKGLTKTYEIWETINVVDLAKILKVDPDDVFEFRCCPPSSSTRRPSTPTTCLCHSWSHRSRKNITTRLSKEIVYCFDGSKSFFL